MDRLVPFHWHTDCRIIFSNVVLTILQHAGNSALCAVFTQKFFFVTAAHRRLQFRHQTCIRLGNGPQTLI